MILLCFYLQKLVRGKIILYQEKVTTILEKEEREAQRRRMHMNKQAREEMGKSEKEIQGRRKEDERLVISQGNE